MTVPRNTPPRRPSRSSRYSVGGHSIAYGPSTRGVVTERAACHHAPSAAGSKNDRSTVSAGALITIEISSLCAAALFISSASSREQHCPHLTPQLGTLFGMPSLIVHSIPPREPPDRGRRAELACRWR